MSKFVKLPSGIVVNLDRIDRMGEIDSSEPLWRYGKRYWLMQSCDAGDSDAVMGLTQDDGSALIAAMGVKP